LPNLKEGLNEFDAPESRDSLLIEPDVNHIFKMDNSVVYHLDLFPEFIADFAFASFDDSSS